MPDHAPESCTPDLVYGLACDGPCVNEWWEIGVDGTPIPESVERVVVAPKPKDAPAPKVQLVSADWKPIPDARTIAYRLYDRPEGSPIVAAPMNLGERGHLVVVILYRESIMDAEPTPNPQVPMEGLRRIAVDFTGQLCDGSGRFHHES